MAANILKQSRAVGYFPTMRAVVNHLRRPLMSSIATASNLNQSPHYMTNEVRAKVIELQDEKSSLITALKLMQRESVSLAEKNKIEDLESENKNLRAAARTLQEDLDKSNREKREFAKVKKRSENVSITPNTTISYESKNQFEVLSVSDHEEEVNKSASDLDQSEARQHKDPVRNTTTISKDEKNPIDVGGKFKDGKFKPNILLIGDSMIKDINPHKLSKSSVRKLTYPEVIIHAGTNNIITDSSKECFDNIQLLSSRIKSTFKEARIAISSLITREDIDVTLKTQKTNELLKDLCSKEGYTYIENGNIDATCLNGSKLHLNAK
ncbi:Hypothetical predicted protein, partial [Paramuricea clavata]